MTASMNQLRIPKVKDERKSTDSEMEGTSLIPLYLKKNKEYMNEKKERKITFDLKSEVRINKMQKSSFSCDDVTS